MRARFPHDRFLAPAAGGLTRRDLLAGAGYGLAGLGLFSALGSALQAQQSALSPRPPHRPAKAKHVIFLFMFGGPSQMDLFDYKPELQKRDGQTIMHERRKGDLRESVILGSRRAFKRHGETGQWCSDVLPLLSAHMDKLAVVKSLQTDSFAHGTGVLQMNSGQIFQGHPSMGAWVTYALGSENADLPGFVVMHDPRGGPISGAANWTSGYMPAAYQGTLFRSEGAAVLNLAARPTPAGRGGLSPEQERRQVDLIEALDAVHAAERPHQSELAARSATYDLAFRMRTSAPEALDLSQEDPRTLAMYGLEDPRGEHRLSVGPAVFGRQCLIARRLIERGVRFVQIYHGGGHQQQTWDAHYGVEENLSIHCPEVDKPLSALLSDLQRTGLLEETLVLWGGEFGRQPTAQLAGPFQQANPGGRDHNPKGFTMWLAGAGVKPGPYGETDELGNEAVVDAHHVRDLHATVLHLLGLDHERLVYSFGGLDRKLTGVIKARPIEGILA
jgi:hypothetical protein